MTRLSILSFLFMLASSSLASEVQLVELQTVDANSQVPFVASFGLPGDRELAVSSTVTNGRGQPFELVHLLRGQLDQFPFGISQATMRIDMDADGSYLLNGLGLGSVTLDDAMVEFSTPDGSQTFHPVVGREVIAEGISPAELQVMATQLGLAELRAGLGSYNTFSVVVPEPALSMRYFVVIVVLSFLRNPRRAGCCQS